MAGGLVNNTTFSSHSPGDKSSESSWGQGHIPSEGSRGDAVWCLFLPLVAGVCEGAVLVSLSVAAPFQSISPCHHLLLAHTRAGNMPCLFLPTEGLEAETDRMGTGQVNHCPCSNFPSESFLEGCFELRPISFSLQASSIPQT